MKTIFTFLFVLIFAISGLAQNQGEVAPDFTLKQLNGQDYKLSDNEGDVILVFLMGYNCSLCRAAAPDVKNLVNEFESRSNFQPIAIDTWDGNNSGVQNFKNTTGLDMNFLVKGSGVASSWSTTYDRLVVIDKNRVMAFKGTRGASSDISKAKEAIEEALDNLTTSSGFIENNRVFNLGQIYPNPVISSSTINFSLKENSGVSLKVYSITGRLVGEYINAEYPVGNHSFIFNRGSLKNGIYFYKMEAKGVVETRKMVLK